MTDWYRTASLHEPARPDGSGLADGYSVNESEVSGQKHQPGPRRSFRYLLSSSPRPGPPAAIGEAPAFPTPHVRVGGDGVRKWPVKPRRISDIAGHLRATPPLTLVT